MNIASISADLGRGQKKPAAIKVLRAISLLLPGDWLKTFVFLNFIHRPRKLLRSVLFDFYRMDHVYFINLGATNGYEPLQKRNSAEARLLRHNGSPFP